MVRCHEIQIVNLFLKKRPRLSEQFLGCDRAAFVTEGDLIILAKKALAGAAAKEDCPGAARARERRLLSEVGPDKGNPAGGTLAAKA